MTRCAQELAELNIWLAANHEATVRRMKWFRDHPDATDVDWRRADPIPQEPACDHKWISESMTGMAVCMRCDIDMPQEPAE